MKRILVGGALVGAVAIGGYAYVDHRFEAEIIDAIERRNADPEVDGVLVYESLDTSLFSGTANITGLVVTNRETKTVTTRVKNGSLKFDVGFGGSPGTLEAFSFDGIEVSDATASISVGHLSADGLNVDPLAAASLESLTDMSVENFKLTDVKASITAPSPMEFSLRQIVLDTTGGGKTLNEFRFEGLMLDAVSPIGLPIKAQLEQIHVRGGNIGVLRDLFDMDRDADGRPRFKNDAMRAYMKESLNYFGFEKVGVKGLDVAVPNSVTVSLDEMLIDDFKRMAGMVVGVRGKLDNFRVSNLSALSPQAAQILSIAELDQFVMNAESKTRIDESTRTFTSDANMRIDDVLATTMSATMSDVDIDAMAKRIHALQDQQISLMERMEESEMKPEDMEAFNAEMMESMLAVYFGYYEGFELAAKLDDIGGIGRGLNVYSAMTGIPADDLRTQFAMAATQNLMMMLGDNTPPQLQETLTGFLASPSTPLSVKVNSKQDMRQVKPDDINETNWGEYIAIDIRAAQ